MFCFSGRLLFREVRHVLLFRGVRRFFRLAGFSAVSCRGPHAAVGETLLGRHPIINELSANRRYRKICYYESGGVVFLSYFIAFFVGAAAACRL